MDLQPILPLPSIVPFIMVGLLLGGINFAIRRVFNKRRVRGEGAPIIYGWIEVSTAAYIGYAIWAWIVARDQINYPQLWSELIIPLGTFALVAVIKNFANAWTSIEKWQWEWPPR